LKYVLYVQKPLIITICILFIRATQTSNFAMDAKILNPAVTQAQTGRQ